MTTYSLDARRMRRAAIAAAGALVLGIAACDIDPEQADPTSLEGSGSVTGQVYFDANGNGRFDPLGGDTSLVGAIVDLAVRGDSTRVLQSTTTDAQGTFTLGNVPIGTHEIRARLTTGQIITCAPIPVTVLVSEQAFASTPLRVSCRIDIVEAEQRSLTNVITVGGIVTAAPGVYRPNNLYLQDETGGMQAFGIPGGTSSGIAEGDSVELTGPLAAFQQELQVSPTNSFRIVTRGRPVEARLYTLRQLRDAFAAGSQGTKPIGELVLVRGARLRGVPAAPTGTAGAGGTDFRLVQGTDSISGRFDVAQNVQANLDVARPDTRCYDVTGILGLFGSTIQLKPRRPSDVVLSEAACSAN
jgi:hypothetical protein